MRQSVVVTVDSEALDGADTMRALRSGRSVRGFSWRALWVWGASMVWAVAQSVFMPWGNVEGTRVSGEPVDWEAGLRWVHPEWSGFSSAVKYLQRPRYSRTGPLAVVESAVDGIAFREELQDTGPGSATLQIQVTSRTNLSLAGGYFCFVFQDAGWGGGLLKLQGSQDGAVGSLRLESGDGEPSGERLRGKAEGLDLVSARQRLSVRWDRARNVMVRRDASDRPTSLNDPSVRQRFLTGPERGRPAGFQVYVELFAGDVVPGKEASAVFRWEAEATPPARVVQLTLDTRKPGRAFEGIGGNFRLQFPDTDPAVIRYNLDHLPVRWGRLELPWSVWHPEEDRDPLAAARSGVVPPEMSGAMETARLLAQRKIPVILSVWNPPRWARALNQPPGLRGTALDGSKLDRICESLASALLFVKEHAGVEAVYFSWNEPETGVEVRQTAEEHAAFIRRMGPELVRRGLSTRLLLGDTAHGTPSALEFLAPSVADPSLHRYVGAVAFHTWRGCTESDLRAWSETAGRLGVPLLVTEAGPDAHLHEYSGIRLEPWFSLQEIELYLRCCSYAQPAAILEWQLTTDYSVLAGGGVYGESGPLRPTQRFWNLWQLGSTPRGSFALPIRADAPEVTCAAFGDIAAGIYTVHIVNRGGPRMARLSGMPAGLLQCTRWVTDADRGRGEADVVVVRDGRLECDLPAASYTTLQGTM